jgi:predicted GTPase
MMKKRGMKQTNGRREMRRASGSPGQRKVIIAGAAGRDFFNFLSFYRNNPGYVVVAFTAAQIPGISRRKFPASMAGPGYRKGIPIYDESKLPELIGRLGADEVSFSYSDVDNQHIMEMASLVSSCGADFVLLGPESTMLESRKPLLSVCAVRTGSGKSPTTRKIARMLREMGFRAAVIRHPMPYGDLEKQAVQRFAEIKDMDRHKCTIEEREEYEGHIENGIVVYAGVDYEAILRKAEKEADIILWDGGNNDFPFYRPDLQIVIADARRAGHEMEYFNGMVNVRMADIVIINKVRTTHSSNVKEIEKNIRKLNPKAMIIKADMNKVADKPELIRNRKVLVVEDGPTLTHGGLSIGAGYLAARKYGAKQVIDPRPFAVGSIRATFNKFTHLEKILPAMGYGTKQMKELERTINRAKCDTVVIGTPIDLGRYLKIDKPFTNVDYDIKVIKGISIERIVKDFLKRKRIRTKKSKR